MSIKSASSAVGHPLIQAFALDILAAIDASDGALNHRHFTAIFVRTLRDIVT